VTQRHNRREVSVQYVDTTADRSTRHQGSTACSVDGCLRITCERKPFCPDHIFCLEQAARVAAEWEAMGRRDAKGRELPGVIDRGRREDRRCKRHGIQPHNVEPYGKARCTKCRSIKARKRYREKRRNELRAKRKPADTTEPPRCVNSEAAPDPDACRGGPVAEPHRTPTQSTPQAEPAPRLDLVAHIREQIEADPEGYANARKLEAVADRLLSDHIRYRVEGAPEGWVLMASVAAWWTPGDVAKCGASGAWSRNSVCRSAVYMVDVEWNGEVTRWRVEVASTFTYTAHEVFGEPEGETP